MEGAECLSMASTSGEKGGDSQSRSIVEVITSSGDDTFSFFRRAGVEKRTCAFPPENRKPNTRKNPHGYFLRRPENPPSRFRVRMDQKVVKNMKQMAIL